MEKQRGEQGGEKGGGAVKSVDVAVTFSVSSLEKSSRARNRETFVSSLSLFLFLARTREKSIEGIVEVAFCEKKAMEGCD